FGRALPRHLEHRGRRVDPEHRPRDRLRDRNRHSPVPDSQLDDRPVGLARQPDVERDVLRHVRGPVVVDGGERVVRAHGGRWYSRQVDPNALETEAQSAIAAASSPDELEHERVRYLGRKSELKQALREVRDRESGMTLNAIREKLEAALAAQESALERVELERRLTEETVDVTLPGEELPLGHLHPITQIRRQIEDAFLGLGYEVRDDREVETTEYNFDKLAFDQWHPTRSHRATFFFDEGRLLRTETSPSQIHALEEREPPIYMVSIGRCQRRDAIDATHYPIFHQFEGLALD